MEGIQDKGAHRSGRRRAWRLVSPLAALLLAGLWSTTASVDAATTWSASTTVSGGMHSSTLTVTEELISSTPTSRTVAFECTVQSTPDATGSSMQQCSVDTTQATPLGLSGPVGVTGSTATLPLTSVQGCATAVVFFGEGVLGPVTLTPSGCWND